MSYPVLAEKHTWFRPSGASIKRSDITSIRIVDTYVPIDTPIATWDASAALDASINCYIVGTELIIEGHGVGGISLSPDASYTFSSPYTIADYFSSLTSITGIELLKLDDVTNLNYMFQACTALEELDLSGWDVSAVTSMKGMFLSAIGTEENPGPGPMSLTSIGDVSNWNTGNVTDMNGMFQCCSNLTTLQCTNWNTEKLTDATSMFNNCTSLTSVDTQNWNTSQITSMASMFFNCKNLESLDVSNWNTGSVTNMSSMFYYCLGLNSIGVDNWDVSSVKDMKYMFCDCLWLNSLNVGNWDVKSVTNMTGMFSGCLRLAHLDVGTWDTKNVTDFNNMFRTKNSGNDRMVISDLDVSTKEVTAHGRTYIAWDTSNATNMRYMFYGCGKLTHLDVSNWNVSKVTSFRHMFAENTLLQPPDFSKWDTSSCISMHGMFNGCAAMKKVDVSSFNTSNVINFADMFEDMTSLEEIVGLENFDTSKGKFFLHMFENAIYLKKLDLSSFDTRNAVDRNGSEDDVPEEERDEGDELGLFNQGLNGMFNNCYGLKEIKLGENFSFNGSGECIAATLPTPKKCTLTINEANGDNTYSVGYDGSDGNWYTIEVDGYKAHVPADISSYVTETYYASEAIAEDGANSEVLVKHGTLTKTAKAIRKQNGASELYKPGEFCEAIVNLTSTEDLSSIDTLIGGGF